LVEGLSKFRVRLLSSVVALTLVASACAPSVTAPAASASTAPSGPRGAFIFDALFAAQPTFDPQRFLGNGSGAFSNLVYDRLVSFVGADLSEVKPQLAASWTVSADARTYTFKMRDNAKFSDGSAVTSADPLFSYNRLKNILSISTPLTAGLTFSAPTPDTFVITSTNPYPGLLVTIANYPWAVYNSKVLKANGGLDTAGADKTDTATAFLDKQSAGSGPYVLETHEPLQRVVLIPNKNNWGDRPPVFEQMILRHTQPQTQLLNILGGESDLSVELSPTDVKQITKNYDVKASPANRVVFIAFNTDPKVDPLAADPNFWEAVKYGLDYSSILALAPGAIRSSFVPSDIPHGLPQSQMRQRDLTRAKAALAKALQAAGQTSARLNFAYASDNPQLGIDQGTVAQRVQANLADVGITVTLAPSPLAAINDGVAVKFSVPFYEWSAVVPPEASQWLFWCPDQRSGLRAKMVAAQWTELQGLCNTAKQAITKDAQAAAFAAVQRYLEEKGPYVTLFQPAQQVVSRQTFKGIEYSAALYVDLRNVQYK
jgi:peptide/nickel transport system substrate-binding protein